MCILLEFINYHVNKLNYIKLEHITETFFVNFPIVFGVGTVIYYMAGVARNSNRIHPT